ncbi:MAG: hypothetical protein ACTS2F_06200 [Thainema sp.]
MREEAVNLFQLLVQAGATPGKDFSFDAEQDVCMVTKQGYQLLKQRYPALDWDSLFEIHEANFNDAIAALHKRLGTNFVDRILDSLSWRIRELPMRQAAWYARQVLTGVEKRTGISLYTQLNNRLRLSLRARLECLLHPETQLEPCGEWISDLVQAAGGSPQDVAIEGGEAVLSEHGLRLLALVWSGGYDLYGELAKGA